MYHEFKKVSGPAFVGSTKDKEAHRENPNIQVSV
jgi:hypothetical protein